MLTDIEIKNKGFKVLENALGKAQAEYFIEMIKKELPQTREKSTREGGQWKGKVWIAEDFDVTPEDVIKSFEGKTE